MRPETDGQLELASRFQMKILSAPATDSVAVIGQVVVALPAAGTTPRS